ncbi:MAG: hypothetical protein IIZ78_19850 [Clostridiales bacterium]|nr:hypothetical protein [Clostridiales bacterium]
MIVIDANRENEYRQSSNKDTEQDAKLIQMQLAIDSINNQVSAIQNELTQLIGTLNDRFSAQSMSLKNDIDTKIRALTETIRNSLTTEQISAEYGIFKNLSVLLSSTISELTTNVFSVLQQANISNANIGELSVSQETVNQINAQNASINSATIELLSVTNFTIQNLRAANIEADTVSAENGNIRNVRGDKVNAKVVSGKEWKTPISTPDNTELLHISIPKYKGIIQLQTENNIFNLTIFNDSSITLNQSDIYIYRVERNASTIDIYLQNVGIQVNYRILHVGSEFFAEETSEIVDRTDYQQNITQVEEVIFFESSDKIVKTKELSMLVGLTANIQEQLNSKQPKILEEPVKVVGKNYFSVETLLEELANVLNSMVTDDIIYIDYAESLLFPYNSIQYDSETETITIIGFRVEYIDGVLWFSKV